MNAEQVARLLGVSAKTVHRHIAKGTITATYVHSQKRDIADDQVEKLRQVLASSHESRQDSDRSQTMSEPSQSLSRQVEELTERLASAEQRIANLEKELQSIAQRPISAPIDQTTKAPTKRPKIASTEARDSVPDTLPSGTLSAVEFAQQIDIEYTVLEGIIRHGISLGRGKEKVYLEVTEEDHPTRAGYKLKSFTPEQQEKAVELLKQHGKL